MFRMISLSLSPIFPFSSFTRLNMPSGRLTRIFFISLHHRHYWFFFFFIETYFVICHVFSRLFYQCVPIILYCDSTCLSWSFGPSMIHAFLHSCSELSILQVRFLLFWLLLDLLLCVFCLLVFHVASLLNCYY